MKWPGRNDYFIRCWFSILNDGIYYDEKDARNGMYAATEIIRLKAWNDRWARKKLSKIIEGKKIQSNLPEDCGGYSNMGCVTSRNIHTSPDDVEGPGDCKELTDIDGKVIVYVKSW